MLSNHQCNPQFNPNWINSSRGFSLLEVLISVLVLSVGLLGLAGLQTSTIRYNHSAYLRSVAVYQAQNIIDRMRANRAGVVNNQYSNLVVSTTVNCSPCTPSQQAQADIYQWSQANRRLLPQGLGRIQNNGNLYTITLMWDNDRSGVTGTNCSGNPQVDLTCLQMEVEL